MERTFFTCCCCWQWLWQSRHRGIEWDSNGGHEENLPFLRMVSQIARIPYTITSQHYTFLCLTSSKSVNYFALGLFFLLLQITLVVPQCSLHMNAVKKNSKKRIARNPLIKIILFTYVFVFRLISFPVSICIWAKRICAALCIAKNGCDRPNVGKPSLEPSRAAMPHRLATTQHHHQHDPHKIHQQHHQILYQQHQQNQQYHQHHQHHNIDLSQAVLHCYTSLQHHNISNVISNAINIIIREGLN